MKLEMDENWYKTLLAALLLGALTTMFVALFYFQHKTTAAAFAAGYSEVQKGGSDYTMWQKK